MGVTVLPSWGDQLGGALASIASSVKNIADPEFAFRRQLEREMITNPELVQHLADLEFQTPGAVTRNLRAILTPGSSGLVTAAAPSMNARMTKMIRDNPDIFTSDPTLMQDMISRLGTGQTVAQRRTTEAEVPLATARASVETARAGAVESYVKTASPSELAERGGNIFDPTGAGIEGRLEAARIRAANAQTPAEKMAARMEYARYAARLGLGNSLALLDARFAEEAQRARPEWINALRSSQSQVAAGIARYNANPNEAELAILRGQVQTLRDYYRILGETPPDIDVGTERGFTGIGRRRIRLLNTQGEDVDPMSLSVPAITQTRPTPARVPPRTPTERPTFTPEQQAKINRAVQLATNVGDIQTTTVLSGPEKVEATRLFNIRSRRQR